MDSRLRSVPEGWADLASSGENVITAARKSLSPAAPHRRHRHRRKIRREEKPGRTNLSQAGRKTSSYPPYEPAKRDRVGEDPGPKLSP